MGLAAHSPTPYPGLPYAIQPDQLAAFIAERRALRDAYEGRIDVWIGLELDHFPDQEDFYRSVIDSAGLDYLVGSVHNLGTDEDGRPWGYEGHGLEGFEAQARRVYGGDLSALVHAYYELVRAMVDGGRVDVVGHVDRITKFGNIDQESPWYRREVEETLQAIARAGTILELNTSFIMSGRGDWQPAPWVLRRALAAGIPMVVSADAHLPENVDRGLEEGSRLLAELGFSHLMELRKQGWEEVPLAPPR